MRADVAAYDVLVPSSLEAALQALAADPDNLVALAGGTDLMVQFEAGHLPTGRYLSIRELPELHGIDVTDSHFVIGALTTFTEIRQHPLLAAECPLLGEAATVTGARAIQNRGTIGGNIINASPAADTPPALLVYDAELELISHATGARTVNYAGFHTGYKTMDRRRDELLCSVRIRRNPAGTDAAHHYRKVGTRNAQAISKIVFAATARVALAADIPNIPILTEVRLALGSVAPTVIRLPKTEAAIVGAALDDALIERARTAVMAEISPIDDIRSTRDYRRAVSGNLVADFLRHLRR